MLAHRVVLRRGLECEPEEWLAGIDEATYSKWEAYYRLEPWGDEQFLLARLISLVSLLVASKAGDKAEDFVIKLEDLMPYNWAFRPQRKADDLQTVEQKLAGMYG
jgi:hypothetical protein